MSELGGTVSYLYWSQRQTSQFLEDNGIELAAVTQATSTPASSIIPIFTRSSIRRRDLRPQIASVIESKLGQSAVTNFDAPGPIRYAKGISSVVFGEFVTWAVDTGDRLPAVVFASADYNNVDRESVAICLFGSIDNFAGRIQKAGPGFDSGWVSSAAPFVFQFLQSMQSERSDAGSSFSSEELAVDGLTIATGQGASPLYTTSTDDPKGLDRPWRRAFTYGDVQDVAEWLGVIYLDVDLLRSKVTGYGRHDGFRRVLIGAPLWVRTPEVRALRLYSEYRSQDFSDISYSRRRRPRHKSQRRR